MISSIYEEFCKLRDQRRHGEEAPEYTEKRAFEIAFQDHQRAYPATLTPDLLEVLGMPNFMCGPIAHAYRDAGLATIPPKAEAEQAFVIDKLVRLIIQHGAAWRTHAHEDLSRVSAALKAKKKGTS